MNFFEKLAYIKRSSPSVDALQVLGKSAAGKYVNKDCESLTDAVSEVIDNRELNRDQIERVSQFANQATWKSMFVESGDVATTFEPADYNKVIENSSESPEDLFVSRSGDYLSDVSESWRDDASLEDAFKVEKVASYQSVNPARESEIEYEKVSQELELTEYALNNLQSSLEDVGNRFYQEVKQAYLSEGAGILQIANAMTQITDSEKFASATLDSCATRLLNEGIRIKKDDELQKAASVVEINTEHPVLMEGVKLYKLASAYRKAKEQNYNAAAKKNSALKSLKDKLRSQ
jgi:hypothetical protein